MQIISVVGFAPHTKSLDILHKNASYPLDYKAMSGLGGIRTHVTSDLLYLLSYTD